MSFLLHLCIMFAGLSISLITKIYSQLIFPEKKNGVAVVIPIIGLWNPKLSKCSTSQQQTVKTEELVPLCFWWRIPTVSLANCFLSVCLSIQSSGSSNGKAKLRSRPHVCQDKKLVLSHSGKHFRTHWSIQCSLSFWLHKRELAFLLYEHSQHS